MPRKSRTPVSQLSKKKQRTSSIVQKHRENAAAEKAAAEKAAAENTAEFIKRRGVIIGLPWYTMKGDTRKGKLLEYGSGTIYQFYPVSTCPSWDTLRPGDLLTFYKAPPECAKHFDTQHPVASCVHMANEPRQFGYSVHEERLSRLNCLHFNYPSSF